MLHGETENGEEIVFDAVEVVMDDGTYMYVFQESIGAKILLSDTVHPYSGKVVWQNSQNGD